MATILLSTIGFTKHSASAFFTKLKEAGIVRVIDIRLNNVSQLAGFTKRDDLIYFLKEICGCGYIHEPCFAPTQEILDAWKKKAIDWPAYEKRFIKLMEDRRIEDRISAEQLHNACLLCSEPTPERCHRRLVAEYLQGRFPGIQIRHL
ncbi:MAG: hypothetical protein A4E60_00959 [Syntrophorhabdus sp. PtaB.Bin047]|jgi:uncharacterized protein (DUF488 family)|nr:MAG: hypothetical protein A4E60_00959 [Syntrophorhabdus sp. PtaB.Bin047]